MSGQDMRKLMEAIAPLQMIDKYTAVNGEKIYTDQTANATPIRNWDWSAVLDSYDGAEDSGLQYMGMGATEDEAIADLNMQLQDGILDEDKPTYVHSDNGL